MYRPRILLTLLTLVLLVSCRSATSSITPAPPPPTPTSAPLAPQAAATLAPTGDPTAPKITLKLIRDAFNQPVYVTRPGDDSGRLFVVEKAGRIVMLGDGQPAAEPFLDIRDRVGSSGSEQGL